MPFYNRLKNYSQVRQRAAQSLLRLQEQLRGEIPPRTVRDTLLLATWNIRDFDNNKFGHGPRLTESLYYIAEIISAFDLVAVQEVSEDLKALESVKGILGPTWQYIVTDVTAGKSGNCERLAFLYDESKVLFRRITGEIVLPPGQLVQEQNQFARTPFLVAFQSGWFKFMLCTVHIYFGAESGEGLKRRIAEIDRIAQFISRRAQKDQKESFILLGDFNIYSPQHQTMQALTKHGFTIPPQLSNVPSSHKGQRHYDQIAFRERPNVVRFGKHAGVFNMYKSVFRDDDWQTYYDVVKSHREHSVKNWDWKDADSDDAGKAKYYKDVWRTYQMSDHFPMWIELEIDFSKEYLESLLV